MSSEQPQCAWCGERIGVDGFRDRLSVKEFHISGLCQACQDKVFGKPTEKIYTPEQQDDSYNETWEAQFDDDDDGQLWYDKNGD